MSRDSFRQVVAANLHNRSSSWEKFPGFDESNWSVLQLGVMTRSQTAPNKMPQLFPLAGSLPTVTDCGSRPSPASRCGMLYPHRSSLVQHMVSQPSEAKVLCKNWHKTWCVYVHVQTGVLTLQNIMILKLTAVHMKLGIHSLLYKQNTTEHYNVFQKFKLIDWLPFPMNPTISSFACFLFLYVSVTERVNHKLLSGIERN